MGWLTAAKVQRSGRTAKGYNFETDQVSFSTDEKAIRFRFSLASKGGGTTDVQLTIGRADFAEIFETTTLVDRTGSMQKMAELLSKELVRQAEIDKKMLEQGREAVHEAAVNAFAKAPQDRNHAERLVKDVVRQLVDKLNDPDAKDAGAA